MAKWSSFVEDFSVAWFLMHFNRTWTNLLSPKDHRSVPGFPNGDLCVLWPEWNCGVLVVWDVIRKMYGARCAHPAPLVHLHAVNSVRTSCVLLAACGQGILEHALHMWDSLKDVSNLLGAHVAHLFLYIAAVLGIWHWWCWLPHDQCSSMGEWSKTPVAWSNIWTSRAVRHSQCSLIPPGQNFWEDKEHQ